MESINPLFGLKNCPDELKTVIGSGVVNHKMMEIERCHAK